ncbi:MAG: TIGR00296 family protein [Candidatus Methanofastidiosa archaeon]|nr:TIGR00296 family protein [Candidatus Methanofastidiosa archaeon]
MYNLEEGKKLVFLARKNIESYLEKRKNIEIQDVPESFKINCGVFVTLHTYPKYSLRGCIGYPEPVLPLIDALLDASTSSATRDPRFQKVRPDELKNLVIEVTVLTPPELVKVKEVSEYPSKIEVGKDGLIVELGYKKGLLLPQVPVEEKWDSEDFLSHTCIKAGLTLDCWMDNRTKIYKFQGQIFSETKPEGEVIEKNFMG